MFWTEGHYWLLWVVGKILHKHLPWVGNLPVLFPTSLFRFSSCHLSCLWPHRWSLLYRTFSFVQLALDRDSRLPAPVRSQASSFFCPNFSSVKYALVLVFSFNSLLLRLGCQVTFRCQKVSKTVEASLACD